MIRTGPAGVQRMAGREAEAVSALESAFDPKRTLGRLPPGGDYDPAVALVSPIQEFSPGFPSAEL